MLLDLLLHLLFIFKRISLCLNPEKVPVNNRVVIQEYIEQPLLINKHKFHVRCFVLVTSCDPPRIFLFSDGLVFLASDPYMEGNESNRVSQFLHGNSNAVLKMEVDFLEKQWGLDHLPPKMFAFTGKGGD